MSFKDFKPSWGMVSAIAVAIGVVMGSSGLYAGWKLKVSDEAIMREQWRKHLADSEPRLRELEDNLILDAKQEARLLANEQRVAELTGAMARTNDKLDRLIEELMRQNNERRYRGGGQP